MKPQVSKQLVQKVACKASRKWFVRNRKKGIRALLRLMFKSPKWIQEEGVGCVYSLYSFMKSFEGCISSNPHIAAQEIVTLMRQNRLFPFINNSKPAVNIEDIIAILDKYKICDEFSD